MRKFEGINHPLITSLSVGFEVAIFIFAVDYTFRLSDTRAWADGAGIHALDLTLQFKSSLSIISLASSEEEFLGPSPNLRASSEHAFNEKLLVGGGTGWLAADNDK
ncbi:MAG: hypothetical protein JJ956_02550 [Pseudomonadales bacterium]|nr:hypothetical protein [Pseudomonadales bacterium]